MRRLALGLLLLSAFASAQFPVETDALRKPTFQTGGDVLIKNGRLLTITGGNLDGYDLLIRNGKIAQIARNIAPPADVRVIDATGKFVTPGIVDAHSHRASDDTNEFASAITSETRILDVLNPAHTNLYYALASGMTTSLVLHGSANPIGGQSLVIKNKWNRPNEEVIFRDAPQMIKFALGENPKGDRDSDNIRFPLTRMGVEAIIRRAFADAKDYIAKWDRYERARSDMKVAPPRRDLRLEAIADILRGKTWVQCHSYRQDEMLMMAKLSKELGFKLVLQHALEGYKIAPELAKLEVPVSIFGGGFAYKLEVIDSTPMAAAILDKAGVLVSINTDTFSGTVPITQDAARAMRYGVSEQNALKMVTINPAKQLGVDAHVGSLEVGKDGDIAIWQGHPLSVYTKCAMTLIDGEVFFERRDQFGIDATSMAAQRVTPNTHSPVDNTVVLSKTGAYLLKGATVHPVSGPAQTRSSVLINGGKIVAVGPNLQAPAGASTIDVTGMHVYPGFIDAGARPGLDEIGQIPQALDANENGDSKPDLRAINSTNPESRHLPKAFTHGVTTILEMPAGGVIAGQAAIIRTVGSTIDQLAIDPLGALVVNVPAGVEGRMRDFLPPEEITRREAGVKDRQKQLSEQFAAAKRYLAAKDAGQAIPTDIKLEAFRPYLNRSKPVLMAANSASAIRNAVSLAKEHNLRGIIFGGAEAWRVAPLLKESGTPVILVAPAVSCPEDSAPTDPLDPYDTPFVSAELLRRAGVKFCFTTNSMDASFDLPNQVGRTVAYGLPHDWAIRAMTLDAAEILGVGQMLGSLQPGKVANVVVTDGDPLEMTTQVQYVFVDGKPVPLESRYTELYRKYMGRVTGGNW